MAASRTGANCSRTAISPVQGIHLYDLPFPNQTAALGAHHLSCHETSIAVKPAAKHHLARELLKPVVPSP